jgi:hypothetical protein
MVSSRIDGVINVRFAGGCGRYYALPFQRVRAAPALLASRRVGTVHHRWVLKRHPDRQQPATDSTGCAIPSLAAEAARAEPEVKSIMAEQLRASFEAMEQAYGEGEGAEQFAVTASSMMIGAMTIARVLGDDPLSDRVLALVRKSLLEMEAAGKRANC